MNHSAITARSDSLAGTEIKPGCAKTARLKYGMLLGALLALGAHADELAGAGALQPRQQLSLGTAKAQAGQETNEMDEQQAMSQKLQQLRQLRTTQWLSGQADASGQQTREQVIAARKQQPLSVKGGPESAPGQFANPVYHEFAIYDAGVQLQEDLDYDGFYRSFSVTFDADVYGFDADEYAQVYAELYLSREGGPWVHYFSSDIFTLRGDSSLDDYQVLTRLYQGYDTAHYDVLIDLYEVGFGDVVASISSNETDELYALPLESSDLDIDYRDSYSEGNSGGALSSGALMSLALLAGLRRRRRLAA